MSAEENLAMFKEMTGASAEHAAMFLEMAGGDMETAIQLYFDGGGAAPMEVEQQAGASPTAPSVQAPEWWNVIWPCVEEPPEAWTRQQLSHQDGSWKGGIPQPKNGPCGVLAVVHGLILVDQHHLDVSQIEVSAEAVANAVSKILLRCRPDEGSPVKMVRPKEKGQYGPASELYVTEITDPSSVLDTVKARIQDFQGPGGIIDLMYSAIWTRGFDLVKKEATSEGGELPLVPKVFNSWLCSMELLSLLLRGIARGNVGIYSGDGTRNTSWDGACEIGLLSSFEKEQGIPVNEALKAPKVPVWILHGGDHFTLAWSKCLPSEAPGTEFSLNFWNGLPPGGPMLAELAVHAVKGAIVGKEAQPKFFKPEPGEVDEVIQADPADKAQKPNNYRSWRFEVTLAWDRPDLEGEVRGPDVPPEPKIDQEDARYQRSGPWRCRSCYDKRFQTGDFSLVPDESPDFCPKCNKTRKECGWSIWMPFADLPPKKQEMLMVRHAKKIEPILWTKWPAAEVRNTSGGELPAC